MRRYPSILVIAIMTMMLLPMSLVGIAEPTIDVASPQENDVINNNVFTVSGTASGSDGKILQTTQSNFQQGSHTDTSATSSGDVVIFPMPAQVKQNNGDPVLTMGASGAFDDEYVTHPSVVLKAGTYHLWYVGNDNNNDRIGYATSTDGIAWTKMNNGNYVLDKGTANDFDSFGVSDPWVMDDGGTWKMWYSASDGLKKRIGYATSSDGIVWNKQGSEVLDLGAWSKFDSESVSSPTVLKIGSTYHMWYMGFDGTDNKVGYATSATGTSWTRQNNGNPVMTKSQSGGFDGMDIGGPSVLAFNGVYKMFYTGNSGSMKKIGLATSVNGVDWIKQDNANPVLSGTNGKFDWKHVYNPVVILDGTTERMWYCGENSTTTQLGYAKADITSIQGSYLSPPFDLGGDVQFGSINWTIDSPPGTTVSVMTHTQPKNQNWGPWSTPTSGGDLGDPDGWRFQYKVTMTSDDIAKTPAFKDITLSFYKPVVRVEVSTGGGSWNLCTGTDTWSCDVWADDGDRVLTARSIDSAGGHSLVKYINLTINGDIPVGSIVISDDATFTNSQNVGIKLNATDSTGVVSMMLSEDDTFTGVSWEAFSPTKAFTLSEGDGYKNIYVKFKDFYGVSSEPTNDSIILDTTPPNGTIKINNGEAYTNDHEVVLELSAKDKNGVTGMIISEDPTFEGLSPQVLYDTEFYQLSPKDGEKTVYARYFDTAGNHKDYSATIDLDTTLPTGSLMINSNAAVTITKMVNLTLKGKDRNGIKEMMISNLDTFEGSSWENYSDHKIWQLSEGKGDKVVFVKFRDGAGLESQPISDSIVYEIPGAEGVITINEGDGYTNDTAVDLTLNSGGLGTVLDMRLSNDPGFFNSSWEPFSEHRAWDLEPGDGLKVVYVRFLTLSGIETEGFKDNITLDTGVPTLTFGTPNGTTVKAPLVPLKVKATDAYGVLKVEVQVDDGPGWEEAKVNSTDPDIWHLDVDTPNKGEHTISVRVTDMAGNQLQDQLTVFYKPKKKRQGPFLDVALIVMSITLALVLLGRKDRFR